MKATRKFLINSFLHVFEHASVKLFPFRSFLKMSSVFSVFFTESKFPFLRFPRFFIKKKLKKNLKQDQNSKLYQLNTFKYCRFFFMTNSEIKRNSSNVELKMIRLKKDECLILGI